MGPAPFALDDMATNPHPAMLQGAIQAQRTARAIGGVGNVYYWMGYLQAMCDATGETPEAMTAWMRRNDPTNLTGIATFKKPPPQEVK